jgi:CHAT domain-containing protein
MLRLIGPAHGRFAVCLSAALFSVVALPASSVQASQAALHKRGCLDERSSGRVLARYQWTQRGSTVERRHLPPGPGDYPQLVRVEEHGVDVEIEIEDRTGSVVARSNSPVERSATQYVYLPASLAAATLIVRAQEPAGPEGTIRVTFLAGGSVPPEGSEDCAGALRQWADGDMSYARGRALTLGRATADTGSARTAFETAARAYSLAREALPGPTHASERGLLELNLAALAYYGLKDWSGSAYWGARASATFAVTHETYRRARAQAIEAAAWIELATRAATVDQTARTPQAAHQQFVAARSQLAALAQLHSTRHEWYDRALQINNIGAAYTYESRFEAAIPYFSRAQRSFESLGETTRSALALQNIGYCDWGLGRLSAALTKFDRAMELMASMERPNLYLIALSNNGLAHYEAGRFDEALRLETQALDLATRLQSSQARARSYFGIGVTYYAIGDRELAADFLRRGLEIATPELDARLRVDTLRTLAQIEYESGRLTESTAHDSEALRLATASWARARILLHLAQGYGAQGDETGSRRILDELISHPPSHDELVRAMARVQRARLWHAAGSLQLAQNELLRAIETFDRFDSLADRFEARVELARVYADQGLSAQALTNLRRALRYSLEIRAQTANPEYRTSIVQSLRPALSLEVDLLHARFTELSKQMSFDAAQAVARESLAAVDGDRAGGFQAWRAEYLEQRSDTELARLLSSSSSLYRDMAERRFELGAREDRAGTNDARARVLREDIARLRVRLGLITAEIARRSGSAAEYVSDVRLEAAKADRALTTGHAVIEYWLGTTHAYAWVLKGTTVDWIELPASEEIDRAARGLHAAMRSPAATAAARRELCSQLYRLVLAPLGPKLAGVRELTIVPDRSLHYVPFSALRDPVQSRAPYLVQTSAVSIAPALRFLPDKSPELNSSRRVTAGSRMLIIADPIYAADDPRLGSAGKAVALAASLQDNRGALRGTGVGPDLVRLESSAREASRIRALFGPQNVDLLEGVDATRDAVLARDLAHYRFIHIASHGLIDSEIPQLSALILGTHGSGGPVTDPYLRAADLLTRTFHAQAIVLSACDTALGKEYGNEGLVGLRYAALARGAHSVVATLWPVSDGVAATLMTDMYRGVIASDGAGTGQTQGGGLQVARALATAMREELAREPALDPALWAPFTVYVAGD